MADSAFIDTLDIMDLEHLEVGENAVIGEGTTIVCHTFQDGNIIYNTVSPCFPFSLSLHIFSSTADECTACSSAA